MADLRLVVILGVAVYMAAPLVAWFVMFRKDLRRTRVTITSMLALMFAVGLSAGFLSFVLMILH